MYNARVIQEQYESTAAFFERYGFVLLKSETQVKEWNENKEFQGENDITRIYHREVESMVHNQLYPDGASKYTPWEIDQASYVIRRGPGSADTRVGQGYGYGVHQDYGMGVEAYQS